MISLKINRQGRHSQRPLPRYLARRGLDIHTLWLREIVRKRHEAKQIACALKHTKRGIAMEEVIREMGINEAASYNWEREYPSLGEFELRKLKQLGKENRKLKKLVADLNSDKRVL